MIEYENLDLRIQTDRDGFSVVARRGTHAVSEPFNLLRSRPWDLEDLEREGPDAIRKHGAALFDALIHGKVRNLYEQARGSTGSDAGKGLRIRIAVDSRDVRLRPFTLVPWEILYDPSSDASNLLALDPRRAIVRMIDSSEPHVEPAPGPLRRILLAAANPVDARRLEIVQELIRIEEILLRRGLRPDVLPEATRSELQDRIRDGAPQIVHFLGHGSFDPRHEEGALLMEGEGRARDVLQASIFARFFVGRAMPRLVVLNSCVTASEPKYAFNAFASVATALIAVGLPAVIAMQSTIRDSSATRFADQLYGSLMNGVPIEAALSDARADLSSAGRYMLDWAAPVLYMRAHGGDVVETTGTKTPLLRPSSEPPPSPARPGVVVNGAQGTVIIGGTVHVKDQRTTK